MKHKPLKDWMIIERYQPSKEILMPESVTPNQSDLFKVLDIGPDVKDIKIGEYVSLIGYITTITAFRGEKLLVGKAGDVCLVLGKPKE